MKARFLHLFVFCVGGDHAYIIRRDHMVGVRKADCKSALGLNILGGFVASAQAEHHLIIGLPDTKQKFPFVWQLQPKGYHRTWAEGLNRFKVKA